MLGEGEAQFLTDTGQGEVLVETSPVSHHLNKSHCFQVGVKAQLAAEPRWHFPSESATSSIGGEMRKVQVPDHLAIHPAEGIKSAVCSFVRRGMRDWVPVLPSQYHCVEESEHCHLFPWTRVFFCWCLVIVGWIVQKGLLLLNYFFPSHLKRRNFSWGPFCLFLLVFLGWRPLQHPIQDIWEEIRKPRELFAPCLEFQNL